MATGSRGLRQGEPAGVHVSLNAPRPDASRKRNEYVDTPLRGAPTQHSLLHNNNTNGSKKCLVDVGRGALDTSRETVFRQPNKKGAPQLPSNNPPQCSIICPVCKKCRCNDCREPRRPPSFWLCSNFCLCSVDSCVDYASCLCCVKGLMYHWGGGDGDDTGGGCGFADDPCSCSGTDWLSRWTCLALSSLALPCLCLYCPLRAAANVCQSTYASCSNRGCTCQNVSSPPPPL